MVFSRLIHVDGNDDILLIYFTAELSYIPCVYVCIYNTYFLKIIIIFKNFNWRLITLQYVVVFAIHSHESAMGTHVFPSLNPPSHLPSHPIPQGHPSAPALSTLSHASKTWTGDLFHI